ncbi:hypothetical protein [Xanthobacter autotrophicus]|uniref:hypothetical protein n=1 Tax=Xanthobacter autotrophicus TaxID=280 RepID=UPI0037263222
MSHRNISQVGTVRRLTWDEIRKIRSDQWSRYAREQEARRRKEKRGQKLKAAARSRFIDIVAPILSRAEPTPFAFEGVLRAGIRSRLCLKGWEWGSADRAAEDVVLAALNRIGAVRPTWKQGQPEWTQDGVAVVERVRCVNCGAPLPDGHTKYCGPICRTNYTSKLYYLSTKREEAGLREVIDGLD